MDKKLFDALQVRFVKLQFTVMFKEDCILPKDKVSAIRGGMGEMLLRMNCVRDRQCESCDFETECIVQKIMYAKLDKKPEFVTKDGGIGYVLECENYEEVFRAGEKLTFYMLLFGKTIAYFYQLYQAFSALGEQEGIGKEHAKFQIIGIKNMEGASILENHSIDMNQYVIHTLYDYTLFRRMRYDTGKQQHMLIFDTPLTLKYRNEFLQEFRMDSVLDAIKRRIYILDCFEGIESDILKASVPVPEILFQEHRLVGVSRYSMRKNEKMILKGLKGYVILSGLSEDVIGLLLIGELIHIGKNTSFGFGRFHMKCVEE